MKKVITVAVLAAIGIATIANNARADSFICQYSNSLYPGEPMVFSEAPKKDKHIAGTIKDVHRLYYRVTYYSGDPKKYNTHLYLNTNLLRCHFIEGNSDKLEAEIVENFVNMLLGNIIEGEDY